MLKVCGINNGENLQDLAELSPEFVGFIFYDYSSRNCTLEPETVNKISLPNTRKVGVFVNAPLSIIKERIDQFQLDVVQLHGQESTGFSKNVADLGVKVWKAFSIDEHFNFSSVSAYDIERAVFDAKGPLAGGNGYTFNWDLLNRYKGNTPFLLSGGVGPEHLRLNPATIHPKCVGFDINSRFELKPGLKDIELIRSCIA